MFLGVSSLKRWGLRVFSALVRVFLSVFYEKFLCVEGGGVALFSFLVESFDGFPRFSYVGG